MKPHNPTSTASWKSKNIMTLTSLACSLLLASNFAPEADAFAPAAFTKTSSSSPSALHVSSVKRLFTKEEAEKKIAFNFETETPQSTGADTSSVTTTDNNRSNRGRKQRRKHDFNKRTQMLQEEPDLDFYTLHSSAVSNLSKDMPIDDILRAIKRAQNLHDSHDMATIATYLIEGCEDNSFYGFRGSLLSRLAVAALHIGEQDIAFNAIETRHIYERPTIMPHESAAIVRGLMRVHQIDRAWEVLEDELRLPLEGSQLDSPANQELLKHRALSLVSITSRLFFEGEPYVAARACLKLQDMGPLIGKANIPIEEFDMPWARLMQAATECNKRALGDGSYDCKYTHRKVELPKNLVQCVWSAMMSFSCLKLEDRHLNL
jgi:hypothetical protein